MVKTKMLKSLLLIIFIGISSVCNAGEDDLGKGSSRNPPCESDSSG